MIPLEPSALCPFPTVFFHSLIWSVQPPSSEAGPLESLVLHPQVAAGCCKDEQSGYGEELSTKYRVAYSLGSYWPPSAAHGLPSGRESVSRGLIPSPKSLLVT